MRFIPHVYDHLTRETKCPMLIVKDILTNMSVQNITINNIYSMAGRSLYRQGWPEVKPRVALQPETSKTKAKGLVNQIETC